MTGRDRTGVSKLACRAERGCAPRDSFIQPGRPVPGFVYERGEYIHRRRAQGERRGGCGFGPHQLLEAALATCLTITVRKFAAEHKFPLDSASAEVLLDRS